MGVALGMRENRVLPYGPAFVRDPDVDRGYSDREHRRMMGHTNIDSTQVYAQVTDRKISSDMDRLMERRSPRMRPARKPPTK